MDSFLDFYPSIAVILNIELDHVDYFKDLEQVIRSYSAFADITGERGVAVANLDDENVRAALGNYRGRVVGFGISSPDADYSAADIKECRGRYSFKIMKNGELFTEVALSVTGYHNIYNALACAAAADLSGISPKDISAGLAAFRGAKRRMEYKGEVRGADLYEDYGHHPTEISATLGGAKGLAEGGRLICLFQPHTYSRTAALFEDFASALRVADRVIVTDIYAARELDEGIVSSKQLAEAIGEQAVYGGDIKSSAESLLSELIPGDVAIVMGAGDVGKVFKYIS